MDSRMFYGRRNAGITFQDKRYYDPADLLSALQTEKCAILSDIKKLQAQHAEANALLMQAKSNANSNTALKHEQIILYKQLIQANLLLNAEPDLPDAIPLIENNIAYSDKHPLCVASLYGCVFLVIKHSQSHLCMGMHLFHGKCGGVTARDITMAIRQFIAYTTHSLQASLSLDAYLVGGSDISFALYETIFTALSGFNTTIKQSHLTIGDASFENSRPTYISFDPTTHLFSQKYRAYEYSDLHFSHVANGMMLDALHASSSTLSLVAICQQGKKISSDDLLDNMIFHDMSAAYHAFQTRYEEKNFMPLIANLPDELCAHTNLSALFHRHQLHGLVSLNDLARMILCAVIYPDALATADSAKKVFLSTNNSS